MQLYNLIMEDLDTKRKPIQKVDAMSPRDFIRFLKELIPYIKDGKVDLKDVRITEKCDGQSLKLLTINGLMKFESSYSGVSNWDKVPMKEAAKFLYDNYSQLFGDIYELIGVDFKLVGELIWIDEMEETGKVTPVGASYLTDKFGTHGGMVVFDILKRDEDNWVPFYEDEDATIFNMVRDLNNEDFSFYLSESIDITKNVTFELDIDQIQHLLQNPDLNKPRFDKRKDAQLLEEIKQIKQNVCAQLSKTIDNTKGAFSEEGDLIEGIVIRINSSGNQYGAFSNGYKDMKHGYWESFDKIELIWNEFFKEVFSCIPMRKKKDLWPKLEEDFNQFKAKFDELRPPYLNKMEEAVFDLSRDKRVPKAAKRVQMSMAQNSLAKLQEADYTAFVNKYVLYKEDEENLQ